jgi:hypothetical protein
VSKSSKVLPAVFKREAIPILRAAGHTGEIALVEGKEVVIIHAIKAKQTQKPLTEERMREILRQELAKLKKKPPRKPPYSGPTFVYGTPFTRERKEPKEPTSRLVAVYGAPFTRKRRWP